MALAQYLNVLSAFVLSSIHCNLLIFPFRIADVYSNLSLSSAETCSAPKL